MLEKIERIKKKSMALSQIFLLVIGTIAVAYIIGSSFPSINAQTQEELRPSIREEPVRPPSGTNLPSEIGRTIIIQSVADKIKGLLSKPATLSQKEKEALAKALRERGHEDLAKKVLEGKPLTKAEIERAETTNPGWFKKFVIGQKGTSKWTAYKNSLYAAGVTFVLVVGYTFFMTWYKTGDRARATEAAGRVAIGAGVGFGAYTGLVAAGVIGPAGWIAAGFIVVGAWASKFLKREESRMISFQCKPWQAQTGGNNCDLCNNREFPCTEYQCKSLGIGCEIVNKDTDNPRCVYRDFRNTSYPKITPWKEILTEGYNYNPLPRGQYGVEIKYGNKECLPAFQPFTFGVTLDKEGYCKIDSKRTESFEEMQNDFGGSNIFKKNHSQTMNFPGVANLEKEGLNISNGGEFEFYVRCQAADNGKSNRDEFLFKFCVDKGPDTTSPIIRGFNWNDKSTIAYFNENEKREVNVIVYVNEPASCRWTREDKDYADMENNLTCADSVTKFDTQFSYPCFGKLTGLENGEENKFFFRCNDTFGNVNTQSKALTLIGTRQLLINSVSPNNTIIRGSTSPIKITLKAETLAGEKEGRSTCQYSTTEQSNNYIKFTNTNSNTHLTNIWLEEGNYTYYIKCIDGAGNSDTKRVTFSVETDTQAPIVVRAFKEGNYLKIITNEKASCVYSTATNLGCTYLFEKGTKMSSLENNKHQTDWKSDKTFYIKCEDEFGNRPSDPGECSIIINPYSIKSQ